MLRFITLGSYSCYYHWMVKRFGLSNDPKLYDLCVHVGWNTGVGVGRRLARRYDVGAIVS